MCIIKFHIFKSIAFSNLFVFRFHRGGITYLYFNTASFSLYLNYKIHYFNIIALLIEHNVITRIYIYFIYIYIYISKYIYFL